MAIDMRINDNQAVSVIVAASDSLHPERADYVCDGADDNVQIQAAIDALPDTGGKIALKGIFSINDTIHLYRDVSTWFNVFLWGEGLSATRLTLANGSNCDMFDVNVLNHNSGFKGLANMSLDGNKANQTSGHGIYCRQSGSGTMYDMRFKNVFVDDCKDDGFKITNGWGVYLNNCLAEHCGGSGLYFTGSESYIHQFHSSANNDIGIYLRGDELHCTDCRISTVDIGIDIYALTRSVVSNNTIKDFGISGGNRMGMYIHGDTKHVNIHNNVIRGNGADSVYGLYYSSVGADPTNFHHNVIDTCTHQDLIVDSNATNLNFVDNTLSNIPVDPIQIWGTSHRGNIIIRNRGINPIEIVASPVDNTNFVILPYKGGLAAAPNTANQDYVVGVASCRIISSGGTGVAIVIKDSGGNTICSPGATCDESLEIGWKINFGNFSAAPTEVVIFK